MSFLVVGLNPVIQRTLRVSSFESGSANEITLNRTDVAGQGANTTRILSQLGEYALNLCQLGEHDVDLFTSLTEGEGIQLEWISAPGGVRNCHTILDSSSGSITELVEEGVPVTREVEHRIMERFLELLPDFEWVAVTGSKAPGFSDEVLPYLVREARKAGKKVGLDIRGEDLRRALKHEPKLVKINVPEFLATVAPGTKGSEQGLTERQREVVEHNLKRLTRESSTVIALSHGKNPSFLAARGEISYVEPPLITPVNTIGCGDAVMAGMLAGLHEGMSNEEALAHGHECAATNARLLKPGSLFEGEGVSM
ncbi:MAG: 1-phosphofructokinase family hexose kinase [Spirochaetaceae bacterium]